MKFLSLIQFKLLQLKNNNDGNIAIMFAVVILPLFLIVGGAIDYARQVKFQQKLQSSNDLAALAAAKAISLDKDISDEKLMEKARQIYASNLLGIDSSVYELNDIVIVREGKKVIVHRDGHVDTSVLPIIGMKELGVKAITKIGLQYSNVEMALILDVSGSMGMGMRLDNLKDASYDLIEQMMGDESKSGVRIGLVPWSEGVNLKGTGAFNFLQGDFIEDDFESDHCGAIREDDLTDNPPLHVKIRNSETCPGAKAIPLTNDKDLLIREIRSWFWHSSTASDIGLFWGYGMLSPKWKPVWGDEHAAKPYGSIKKIAVLMTDGVNSSPNGDPNSIALCNDMKSNGIHVFTIGFEAGSDSRELLEGCASDSESYFDANSGTALKNAFNDIVNKASGLYISE